MKLINAVSDFLTTHHIKDCSVLVAVSGGRDSMSLLHCLYHLRDTFGLRLNVAYVNHHIRDDSDDEETFVTQTISNLENVTLYKHIIDRNYWHDHTQSIEETARRIRYDFFRQTCQTFHIDYIATAHHFDDRIETFFINMLRGGGVETLVSIPAMSGNIIRPLLTINRSQIDEYIEKNNIPYIDDSTNSGDDYTRNRIRHHILPEIAAITPHFRQSFAHVFDYIAENVAAVDWLSDQAMSYVTYTDSQSAVIDRSLFANYPIAVCKNVVKRIIANLHYPCAISHSLLETICTADRINFTSGSLIAVSKASRIYLVNTDIPHTLPQIKIENKNTADVDIHKTLVIKNDVSQLHGRHILPSDLTTINTLLSNMQIPKILFDYVTIIADEDETPAAIIGFGMFRVHKNFFAIGDKCKTILYKVKANC